MIKCTWDFLFGSSVDFGNRLRGNSFSGAIDHFPVFDKSLDQPMVPALTYYTFIDTVRTKIKIPVIADAAMPMSIRNSYVAAVAANCKGCSRNRERLICTNEQSWTMQIRTIRLRVVWICTTRIYAIFCHLIDFRVELLVGVEETRDWSFVDHVFLDNLFIRVYKSFGLYFC